MEGILGMGIKKGMVGAWEEGVGLELTMLLGWGRREEMGEDEVFLHSHRFIECLRFTILSVRQERHHREEDKGLPSWSSHSSRKNRQEINKQ